MNDEERMQQLQARKRTLKHAIREERIKQNAADREARKQERFSRLKNETRELEIMAERLGINV
jgi:hypothetical protein